MCEKEECFLQNGRQHIHIATVKQRVLSRVILRGTNKLEPSMSKVQTQIHSFSKGKRSKRSPPFYMFMSYSVSNIVHQRKKQNKQNKG